MIESIVSSFALVAASEMGDKTQLLAFSLAARFKRPWPVIGGIFVATIFNHALASTAGQWISSLIAPSTMMIILAVLFLGFALWTLRPDTLDASDTPNRQGAFVTTTVLFFLAEMGDKTQLATVALAARYQDAISVTFGTTLGMMLTDGLAVFLGDRLAHKVQMHWIRWFAATLFMIFGVLCGVQAYRMS